MKDLNPLGLMQEKTMRRLSAVVAAVALLAGAGAVVAHEGHAHKVMGTVAALDATHIEVDTKDGEESYALTKDTKYLKGKKAAAHSDVQAGMRVVLSVVEKDGKKSVTQVLLGAAKSDAPVHKP